MGIKKVPGGYVVVHHKSGELTGKRIPATKKPVSYKKALSIHRAIFVRRDNEENRKKFGGMRNKGRL